MEIKEGDFVEAVEQGHRFTGYVISVKHSIVIRDSSGNIHNVHNNEITQVFERLGVSSSR
jgi:hypothetical protein